MKRRLTGLTPTPHDPETSNRLQRLLHRHAVEALASEAGILLSPAELDTCIAESTALGPQDPDPASAFQRQAGDWITRFVADNPTRRRYSALADWMDTGMSEREKAMREAASWLDNQKLAFFDTETTGLSDEDVPVTAAACTVEGISLMNIKMQAVDDRGEVVHISAGAAKVNHLTDEMIAEFPLLEDYEAYLIGLEGLMEGHYTLAGYFCTYDRQMIHRALRYAYARVYAQAQTALAGHGKEDLDHMLERLRALQSYYGSTEHWLEVKPTLVTAIGLDPEDAQGRRTRLEDVGKATRALKAGAQEKHEALADCQLIVDCLVNIRRDLNEMTKEKPVTATAPKPAPKAAKQPNGPFPPAANPAEKEPEPAQEAVSTELRDYMNTLETTIAEYQTANGELSTRLVETEKSLETAQARIAELEAACESYAMESGGHRHHEAQTIGYLTMEVNGWPVNWTVRQGISPEQALDELFNYLRFVQLIKASDKVKTLRVSPDKWTDLKPMKGFEKATPADEPTPEGYNPNQDKPAAPKGNGASKPTANKPATPLPASKPAIPPPAGQPAKPASNPPTGKQEGAPAFQVCNGLTRNQTNGVNSYELPFLLNGGKQAEQPLKIAKNDTAAFETFLREQGWEPETFDAGVTYGLNIRVDWEWGKPVNADKPEGARYHNKSRFTLLLEQPA